MEVQELIPQRHAQVAPVSSKPRRATVFIVDDEPMVGEVVDAVLGLEGYETRLFTSPLDAWEAFESAETKPDLLISDLVMAPFDGLELMHRCQTLAPDLRTILYSGCKGLDAVPNHGRLPDGFLNKPFLPKELLQAVSSALAA